MQRWDILTSTKSKDGTKTFYHNVGAGFTNEDKGKGISFSINLNALPLDGKLWMVLAKEKEHRDAE